MFAAGSFQILLALLEAGRLPGFDDSSREGEVVIGQSQTLINFDDPSEPPADGASSQRMIEGKEGRGGIVKVPLIAGAEIAGELS